ncbi:MAG: hypothetical protein RBR02_06490 [Desulfuromonadaceae bacterium]|nr:hypothetical protein [Desulfuromonadaceae bacterium]
MEEELLELAGYSTDSIRKLVGIKFVLEESEYIDRDFVRVGEYQEENEMWLAIRSRYRVKHSYYQRILDYGKWKHIDYGSHSHFFRYREV